MTPRTVQSLGLAGLLFLSGVLALVYEVLWQRRFGLLFGSAAPATAAVLAAYFSGLALGSIGLGRLFRQRARPLRIYAGLEILIGFGAFLVPLVLDQLTPAHRALSQMWAANPTWLILAKLAMGFVALALPTLCMGATIPVLAEWIDHGERRLGCNAGGLYLANTLGAGVGACLVPFVMLPRFGITKSEYLAIAGNLLVGLGAWIWDQRLSRAAPESPLPHPPPPRTDASTAAPGSGLVWGLAAFSGWAALALQVLWNRAFAQIHENSIYSFAVIVSLFVFALAAGAQATRIFLRRGVEPQTLLGWAWVGGGCLCALSPGIFLHQTQDLSYLPTSGGWLFYAGRLIWLGVATLFLPIALLGMGLPALMEHWGRSHRDVAVSRGLGTLLAVNVLGSVVGALSAGFWLPGWLGLWRSLLVISALILAFGAAQLLRHPVRSRGWQVGLILFALVLLLLPFRAEPRWPRCKLIPAQQERLIHVSEGSYGIVSVVDRGASRRLKLNNHYLLGGTISTGDERMQSHIPLLIHPDPRTAAFLGVGTAITAGGSSFHPLQERILVELVPEVISTARDYFREANAGVLEASGSHVILEDARNYLRTTSRQFDVIISDLVVPWRQGEGSLFTQEHFAAAQQALRPGGIVCQWLPLFQLSETELNIILNTFLSVFPRVHIWRGDFSPEQPALALIGSREPFRLEPGAIERRIRAMSSDPQNPQLDHAIALWMHFIGSIESSDLGGREERINREDQPWIEILGPLSHAGEGKEAVCTGRTLQAWLRDIRQRSTRRAPPPGEVAVAGSQAGDLLYEFSLSLSEGKPEPARAAQSRLKDLLPDPTFRKIFGVGP